MREAVIERDSREILAGVICGVKHDISITQPHHINTSEFVPFVE
jgi:hypothetical protein